MFHRKIAMLLVFVVALALPAASAFAAPIVYTGYDIGAATVAAAPNASAAAAAFDAAVPGSTLVTFESTVPPGFSFSAGAITLDPNDGSIFCNFVDSGVFCGFNTTPGGLYFQQVAATAGAGASITYDFADPIDSFGAFFSGWQLGTQTISYTNGEIVELAMGAGDDGAALGGLRFFGFTDAGASISSITYARGTDIVGVDDVRFRVVPEAGSLALIGLGLVGLATRRRDR